MNNIKNLLDFLNQNSGSLSLIFSGVVTIATVTYVILTRSLVKETKKLRKVATEPLISIYIEPEERWINLIDLVIKNIGGGPAYNISFRIEPDFLIDKDRNKYLSSLSFMQHLEYLSAGQCLRFFLASAVDVLNRENGKSFKITVSYEGKDKAKYEEEFIINFEKFKGLERIGEPPLHQIAKAIDKISKDIGHLSTGFHRVKTDIYISKDREQEGQIYEQMREESKKSRQDLKPKEEQKEI